MRAADDLRCAGRSAFGPCLVWPKYMVTIDHDSPLGACGRHLSWVVDRRTKTGQSVTVTRRSR